MRGGAKPKGLIDRFVDCRKDVSRSEPSSDQFWGNRDRNDCPDDQMRSTTPRRDSGREVKDSRDIPPALGGGWKNQKGGRMFANRDSRLYTTETNILDRKRNEREQAGPVHKEKGGGRTLRKGGDRDDERWNRKDGPPRASKDNGHPRRGSVESKDTKGCSRGLFSLSRIKSLIFLLDKSPRNGVSKLRQKYDYEKICDYFGFFGYSWTGG